MKKTIALCLLLILIFSCAFSFAACADLTADPIIGKYIEPNRSDIDAFFLVRSDGTATRYVYYIGTSSLKRQFDYTWTYDKETGIYTFVGSNIESYGTERYTLENRNLKQAGYTGDDYSYERVADSEWPDYVPKK